MPPWITSGAREQANDTKELNRVQLPLFAMGKLVDNPVNSSGTIGRHLVSAQPQASGHVNDAQCKPSPLTGYQHHFPRRPLINLGSSQLNRGL